MLRRRHTNVRYKKQIARDGDTAKIRYFSQVKRLIEFGADMTVDCVSAEITTSDVIVPLNIRRVTVK